MSAYGVFAQYYDRLMEPAAYRQRAKRICALLFSYGVAGGTVLDLACGTGEMTQRLQAAGYDPIGVDSSPDMLMVAREKLTPNTLLLCQDMRELDLYGTVDAAICMLDSLNHLASLAELQQTLQRLALFIKPGGVLLFDVNTPYKHREILKDNTFVYELEDVLCVWQNAYSEKDDTVAITLDLFVQQEGDSYTRFTEQFAERAYSIPQLQQVLGQAGFTVLDLFDDCTPQAPGPQTQRILVSAKRK